MSRLCRNLLFKRFIGTSKKLLDKKAEGNSCSKFEFTAENKKRLDAIFAVYPTEERRATLMAVLDLAQRQHGWLPQEAILMISEMFKIHPVDMYDYLYFYDWFRLTPAGKFRIAVCTSTPCVLRGGDKIFEVCRKELGIGEKETSKDMQFSLKTCVCMGACVNAPVLCVNDNYYEDMTETDMKALIAELRKDKMPPAGPRRNRFCSEPKKGLTTLKCDPPKPGFKMQKLPKEADDEC